MQTRLTTSSIFKNKQTFLLLAIFISVRILSFYIAPHHIIQALLVFTLIFILGLTFFKNPDYAWMIILAELFLGGAGHYLEFFGLSIRTVLIVAFLFLWIAHALSGHNKERIIIPHRLYYVLIPLTFFVVFSIFRGLIHGNDTKAIIQDALPFMLFALILPAYHLFSQEKMRHYIIRLLGVFLIGSVIFSLFTSIVFVTKTVELQEPYYKWYRDVTMGKITHVTDSFYRIVAPEHIIITPLLLIIASLLMRDEKHHKMWRFMFMCGALILALNFSRAYLLAFALGLLILIYKHKFTRWFIVSFWSITMITLLFISVNILFSGGKSLGLEIIGIRLGSVILPQTEESTNLRMALLDPIITMIKHHPILGTGLGSSVTFIDPYTYETLSRRHFDWGYLEMWVELGLFGALSLIAIAVLLVQELIKKIRLLSDYHDFYVGLLAGIIAMLFINITTPTLFHVLGILYLVFVMAFVSKPLTIFDEIVTLLYRIFNRIKKQN